MAIGRKLFIDASKKGISQIQSHSWYEKIHIAFHAIYKINSNIAKKV